MKTNKWFREEILPWIEAVGTISAISFGGYAIFQTSHNLALTRDALYLSTVPTVQVEVQLEKVTIKNLGVRPILNLQGSLVLYKVGLKPPEIQARSASTGHIFSITQLAPGQEYELSSTLGRKGLYDPLAHWKGLPIKALIITFQRDIDKKQYMHFEPFIGEEDSNPLFSHPNFAMNGPYVQLFDLVNEIESRERRMIGVSEEVSRK